MYTLRHEVPPLSRSRSFVVCVILISVAPAGAGAQESPSDALDAIREQALYANYREALSAVESYLERDDLTAAQRNAGLELIATVHIALRQTSEAEEALERLYARDPGHRLSDPDASPPVLSAFGRARANPPEAVTVAIEDRTEALEQRAPPRVVVSVAEGLDAVEELRLAYRQDEGGFTTVVMQRDGDTATARVPVLDGAEAYTMSYYVEARAPSGHVLSSLGTQAEPMTLEVPERTESAGGGGGGGHVSEGEGGDDGLAIAIGIIVGVLVVGGGVVAGIFIADEVTGPQDGSLGNIELPLVRF